MIPSRCFSLAASLLLVCSGSASAAPVAQPAKDKETTTEAKTKPSKPTEVVKSAEARKTEEKPAAPAQPAADESGAEEEAVETAEAAPAAVALPVSAEPVQIYGWCENVFVEDMKDHLLAKLDTGALTSSIHAEKQELFERDGKKWVRFIVANTFRGKVVRARMEAPLVRIAKIKEPNAESVAREVVRLSFRIGDRKLRAEFTLNNRSNMVAPVLLGRSTLKDLGWVDPARTHMADQKLLR